ncbi:MAG: hypothetical protein JW850_20770 [Thermoflexales bacterium]|nr:hypothetical protein [Thermoflexales bacterium]
MGKARQNAQAVDQEHITAVLSALFAPGEVVEIRIPNVPRAGTVSGYFDDFLLAARAAARYGGRASGIYFTLNPVNRALLARSANRLSEWVKNVTRDVDIVVRRFLLLDFDPVRPAGISSSEAELAAALDRRDAVRAWLEKTSTPQDRSGGGFPPGLAGMSGNGGHLLYRLPDLPNTQEATDLVQACIVAVKSLFSDDLVSVDDTVYNASRLTKLYGTWACKGDNLPDRPHRLSHLDLPAGPIEPVALDKLYWLADQVCPVAGGDSMAKARSAGRASYTLHQANGKPVFLTTDRRLDVQAYLAAAGQEHRTRQKGSVTWYNLRDCPVHDDPDGDRYECGICQFENGALGAKCQHDPGATWADFKAALGDPTPYYISGNAWGKQWGASPSPASGTGKGDGLDLSSAVLGGAAGPLDGRRAEGREDEGEPVRLFPEEPPGGEGAVKEYTLEHVAAYARCPMEYFLRFRANVQAPPTGEDVVGRIVREALRDLHAGAKPTPFAAVRAGWRVLLGEWGVSKLDEACAALDRYAHLRTELLLPFLRGEILKSDGTPYDEPRKSQAYLNAAQVRGLLRLQVAVDERIPDPPISLRDGECLGDVFSDTVEIALRYQGPGTDDLVGVEFPYSVSLPSGLAGGSGYRLSGWADLVIRAQERGRAGVVAVVYDFSKQPASWQALLHDLRVLALLNAGDEWWRDPAPAGQEQVPAGQNLASSEPNPELAEQSPAVMEQDESWRAVQVHYLRTGEAVSVYGSSNPAWGRALLAAAVHAVNTPGVPRMAIASHQCAGCRYWATCASTDGWNTLMRAADASSL